MYYIQLRPSTPSQRKFVSYDQATEQTMLSDFKWLWATNFLDDLSIEVTDHTFANGTVGKIVVYHMEERERVKIVDYRDTDGKSISIIKRSDIDDKLRERTIEVRLDSFLDDGTIRRVEGVLRELMAEKGFTNAEVESPGDAGGRRAEAGERHVHGRRGTEDQDSRRRVRRQHTRSATASSRRRSRRTSRRARSRLDLRRWHLQGRRRSRRTPRRSSSTTRTAAIRRRVSGKPEVKTLENSKDGKTRVDAAADPGDRGRALRFGDLNFEGNKLVRADGLRTLYKIETGEWYSQKKLQRREQEGAGGLRRRRGFMEWTPFPMLQVQRRSQQPGDRRWRRWCHRVARRCPRNDACRDRKGRPSKPPRRRHHDADHEGPQYFVNRITFTGNTTTRDNVIRREMRLVEGDVFDTEALKYSVRRLNQLGYFKELKGNDSDMKVDKTPGKENTVDVTLKFEEQNRNQLTFGAGVSQYEGFFGQLAFQTSNFLGRGESLTLSVQAGDRAQNYQLAFTEPFLFDRNITGGFDIYKRSLQYIGYYTQKSTGAQPGLRFPGRRLQPHVHELLVRDGPHDRLERGAHRHVLCPAPDRLLDDLVGRRSVAVDADADSRCSVATRSSTTHCSSGRAAGDRSARSCRASCTTPSTTRSSRTRASG